MKSASATAFKVVNTFLYRQGLFTLILTVQQVDSKFYFLLKEFTHHYGWEHAHLKKKKKKSMAADWERYVLSACVPTAQEGDPQVWGSTRTLWAILLPLREDTRRCFPSLLYVCLLPFPCHSTQHLPWPQRYQWVPSAIVHVAKQAPIHCLYSLPPLPEVSADSQPDSSLLSLPSLLLLPLVLWPLALLWCLFHHPIYPLSRVQMDDNKLCNVPF